MKSKLLSGRFSKWASVLVMSFSLMASANNGQGHSGGGDHGAAEAHRHAEQQAAEQRAAQERANEHRAAQERAAEQQRAAQERANEQRAAQERAAEQRAVEHRAAQERAAEQQRAAQERASEQRAAQERAAEHRAAQERAAEQKALEQRAAQERAASQQRVAEQKAAEQKAAQERAAEHRAVQERAAEQKAAEQRAAQERAALQQRVAEQKAAEHKATQQRAAQEKATEQQRIAQQKAAEQQAAEQRRAAEVKAAQEKAAEQQRLAQKKAEEQKVAEKQTAEQRRTAEVKAAQEKAAEQQRLAQKKAEEQKATEKQTAEQRRAAEVKAAHEKAAEQLRLAQKKAEEQKPAEKQTVEQRRAVEVKAAQEKAAEQQRFAQKQAAEKRSADLKRVEQQKIDREKALEQQRLAHRDRKSRIEKPNHEVFVPLPKAVAAPLPRVNRDIVKIQPVKTNPQQQIRPKAARPLATTVLPSLRPVTRVTAEIAHNVGVRPGRKVGHFEPKRLVSIEHPDQRPFERENRRTAYGNVLRVWKNAALVNRVTAVQKAFAERHEQLFKAKGEEYKKYHNSRYHRDYYSKLQEKGFFGGDYYPVHPHHTIETYFAYPMVYWMFIQSPEPEYYQSYYNENETAEYPVEPFYYANDYYPTEELNQMGIDVSGMPADQQANYRQGMTSTTTVLEQLIANRLGIKFSLSDAQIVVNYYENLRNQALVIEGFVDQESLHLPFKALIDLNDPTMTAIFVPSGQEPTGEEFEILGWINDRIRQLGGDPYTGKVYESDNVPVEPIVTEPIPEVEVLPALEPSTLVTVAPPVPTTVVPTVSKQATQKRASTEAALAAMPTWFRAHWGEMMTSAFWLKLIGL